MFAWLKKEATPPHLWGRSSQDKVNLCVRKSVRLSRGNVAILASLARGFQVPVAVYLRHLVLGQPLGSNPLVNRMACAELARVAANLTQLRNAHQQRPFPSLAGPPLLGDLLILLERLRARLNKPGRIPLPEAGKLDFRDSPKPVVLVIRFRPFDILPRPLLRAESVPAYTCRSLAPATNGLLFDLGMQLNRFAHRSNAGKLYDLSPAFLAALRTAMELALGAL